MLYNMALLGFAITAETRMVMQINTAHRVKETDTMKLVSTITSLHKPYTTSD